MNEQSVENDRDARAEELESTFSYDGYQVVRKELFAHLRDPAIVIRKDSITFNTACITGLEDVSNSCEIKCMAFVRMIYRDMRWNQDNTYRLEGKSIPGQQLVSFDLSSPFLVENGIALDENLSPTKPLCGEEMSSAESPSALPIKRGSGAV